jgi:hypothetical protein
LSFAKLIKPKLSDFIKLIVGQPFRVASHARLKLCPTNHPRGDLKSKIKT